MKSGRHSMGASRQWGVVPRRHRPLLHIEMMHGHCGGDAPMLMWLPSYFLPHKPGPSESQGARDLLSMQIWSTPLQMSSSQTQLALEGKQGWSGGGEEN